MMPYGRISCARVSTIIAAEAAGAARLFQVDSQIKLKAVR